MRVSNTIAILLSTAAAASTIAAAFVPTFSYTKYATTTTRRVTSPQLLARYNKLHELSAAVVASAPSSSISSSDIIDNITIHDEINAMRMADIKKELESYGIDSKAYFEKRELVEALVDARRSVGIMGIDGYYDDTTADSFDTISADTTTTFGNEVGGSFATDYGESVDSASSSSPSNNNKKKKKDEKKSWFKPLEEMADKFTSTLKDGVSKVDTNNTRKGRIKVEQTKLKDSSMSVKEMRNELESLYGISTKSYFEKSEFVKALAEARVDGMKKKKKKSNTVSSSTSSSSRAASSAQSSSSSRSHNTDEQWDASYKNVYTRRFDASTIDPRGVIDVSARY